MSDGEEPEAGSRDRWDSPGANFLRQNFLDPLRPHQKVGFAAAALSVLARMFGDNDSVESLPPAPRGVRWLRIGIGIVVALLIIVAVITRLLR